ncbi:hypothetical protein [Micromonospora echinospora]|uniref:hypothetical protein n=1 Tax=Micromonospora echinospora TaxID=1877 RepID=UPI00117C90A7|nr:hypothetical protein [Micromonospora echinospora]
MAALLEDGVEQDLFTLATLAGVLHGVPDQPACPTTTKSFTSPSEPVPSPDHEDDEEERIAELKLREFEAGHRIRSLIHQVSDAVGEAQAAAERGDRERALSEFHFAKEAARETSIACDSWQRILAELYEVSPGSLGAVGQLWSGFEAFLLSEYGNTSKTDDK